MSTDSTAANPNIPPEAWAKLKLPRFEPQGPPVQNANEIQQEQLSALDKLAVMITDKVGSMGFFLIIFCWTICWTGYNILATELPNLHWKSFDPFPAFVAYLLISNVIQIFLMPLIMVGQNLQGKHSETRAQLDFEINQKAEKEVMAILRHLEHNTDLLIQLMKHMDCRISQEEIRALSAEKVLANQITSEPVGQDIK